MSNNSSYRLGLGLYYPCRPSTRRLKMREPKPPHRASLASWPSPWRPVGCEWLLVRLWKTKLCLISWANCSLRELHWKGSGDSIRRWSHPETFEQICKLKLCFFCKPFLLVDVAHPRFTLARSTAYCRLTDSPKSCNFAGYAPARTNGKSLTAT